MTKKAVNDLRVFSKIQRQSNEIFWRIPVSDTKSKTVEQSIEGNCIQMSKFFKCHHLRLQKIIYIKTLTKSFTEN